MKYSLFMKTHPYEACNDLYSSSSYSGVLDLRGWDSSVLKDVVGVKPDLWRTWEGKWKDSDFGLYRWHIVTASGYGIQHFRFNLRAGGLCVKLGRGVIRENTDGLRAAGTAEDTHGLPLSCCSCWSQPRLTTCQPHLHWIHTQTLTGSPAT